ncbi:MAG: hypothetical protein ABS85_03760 [Sphingobacteriales bacterium SCN 48-20]|uniref:hypothetical protein n=1 Tax=Terrimonas ferruginea TaxID=249 RepID=UPI000408FBB3|nr:hypothetical protein [Terrimonas ferruginea]MBN8783986.1 hypothetical protein [Terrimonas ferruginea]ODT94187.1 MAG: hypothetical protein ABS85_03760 [Sphingobacteriales bacterium SCN 48-20]OJW41705.1 MAG: hypothetical protein BGO56_17785 [Sphingobacteriales bacterium 48-107]
MKYSFLLLLLFPVFAHAQDCKLHRDKDPYTREEKLTTGFIVLQGATLSIDANQRDMDFLITLTGSERCVNDQTDVYLFFSDSKQRFSLRNQSTMNCEGDIHHIVRNNANTVPTFLQKLIKFKVASIKVKVRENKEVTITLTEEQQEQLQKLAICMSEEAKTLVKK